MKYIEKHQTIFNFTISNVSGAYCIRLRKADTKGTPRKNDTITQEKKKVFDSEVVLSKLEVTEYFVFSTRLHTTHLKKQYPVLFYLTACAFLKFKSCHF